MGLGRLAFKYVSLSSPVPLPFCLSLVCQNLCCLCTWQSLSSGYYNYISHNGEMKPWLVKPRKTWIHRQLWGGAFPSQRHSLWPSTQLVESMCGKVRGEGVLIQLLGYQLVSLGSQYVTNTTSSLLMYSEILPKNNACLPSPSSFPPPFIPSFSFLFHKYFLSTIQNTLSSANKIVEKINSDLDLELSVQ